MPRVQKRKYEKIDDAEIDLVIQCSDSHEFYERYREAFPTRKKGIDSISKIWKRRGEFIKKQQALNPEPVTDSPSGHELAAALQAQNTILAELSSLMKEQIKVSREILARLPKQTKAEEPAHSPHKPAEAAPAAEHKEPAKKPHEKPRADIMIGS
ncbi:hypothetical protein [Methanoregula sp.]|uniref:hypothetical protein n=1 Tax=Methanoregula sp. TaxID=2052170 RepID=UPI00263968D3|nr:hypothetical protein [Methanoregula sp.]MDD5143552.1 hypothetical protein [Methanoregula sp.]